MDTLAYIAVVILAFSSNISAAILVEKYKRKGLIKCEDDLYK